MRIIFNTKAFAEFNKHKCSELHYLDFDGISIILGEKNGELYSPFSAPFGGFSSLRKKPSLELIEKACEKFYEWLREKNKKCHITLPPPVYGESFISQIFSSLARNGFKLKYSDLNYHFNLTQEIKMQHCARNEWNIANRNELKIKIANDTDSMQKAYEIIQANRKAHGYPSHLPLQEFVETAKATEIFLDNFLVFYGQEILAAALVFTIAPKHALVVQWGDNREKSRLKPMNFLAISIAEYYKTSGYLSLDLGTSSKNGIPNYGLCHFKAGLGCEITLKHTLSL